ncbi:hypothetical protein SAMN05216388_10452 [Halorientalis persicus]|uniref:Uncharacterized protein n=1 Tax=Halorientalis persicus TaxID=1367881 RepID=A0A1H8VZM4_9EURY|nr:hypothetical protein SAMN05216388_10452 [Halorientalis persicus]
MEAVNPHFESVEPLCDVIPIGIVEMTAQSSSREGSQITVCIDEKPSLGEIVFLGESMQKRSCRIGAMRSKQRDIEN